MPACWSLRARATLPGAFSPTCDETKAGVSRARVRADAETRKDAASSCVLITPRWLPTATLLPNGQVLVAGGLLGSTALASAEVYNPASGTWTLAAPMTTPRWLHTATLLPNGKILVAGGSSSGVEGTNTAELYDPAAGTWTATGPMTIPRDFFSATLLPNGTVLVAGGAYYDQVASSYVTTASAELFDPATETGAPPAQ